jgi:hypothetical protein
VQHVALVGQRSDVQRLRLWADVDEIGQLFEVGAGVGHAIQNAADFAGQHRGHSVATQVVKLPNGS